jgi:hypothetical protein
MSVQGACGMSVRAVRGACFTAALVGAMIACTGAESARTVNPAPTGDSRIAPASDSRTAPTGEAKLAPIGESQIAPKMAFDSNRAWEHLRKQVSFGPRPSGTPAIVETRRYIIDQLKAAGIESREQMFIGMTPLGEVSMTNVIATIPGKRSERIVLASHFDTKLYREFRFVGANDGASSTAALLELGRVLKQRANEFTIELLFLDGEEARMPEWRGNDNTYGSRHYVQASQKDKSLATLEGARTPRHDRRPRSAAAARRELDAVAGRHRVGGGGEAGAFQHVLERADDHRRRSHPVSPLRRSRRGPHRSRQPDLAHAAGHDRVRQRP